MQEYLKTLPARVQKNVKVVTPQDLGKESLYHISKDGDIKQFSPEVSRRTASQEDRTIPRISTTPTIVGCLLGYQSDVGDFNEGVEKGFFDGGWYIYGFDFEKVLRPSKQILVDADITDEHWLVPYESDQWFHKAVMFGKFFYSSITKRWEKGRLLIERECYVEVGSRGDIVFANGVVLSKGHHRVVLAPFTYDTPWDKIEVLEVRSISAGDFKSAKKLTADLLSWQTPPPSANW